MIRTIGPSARQRAGARRLTLLAGAGLVALVLSGCTTDDIPAMLNIPDPATKQASWIYSLWQGSWVAAWTVGVIVWALILWAVVVYRKRSDDPPVQVRYNLPIEILYTVVPIFVLVPLFWFVIRDESRITDLSANPQNTVNVVGFRWNWTFNYIGENVYDVGSPAAVPTLYLPVDESVRFTLTSPDVIHSFWVPSFLFKMDMIPGKTNQFEITPTKLGTFSGHCAELCGVDHSRMLFVVKVVTRADYDQHMKDLTAKGQVGLLASGQVTDGATGKQGRTTIGGNP